jgi:hypothetical protein
MRAVFLAFLCILAFGCRQTATANQTQRAFERHYAQWLIECKQPKVAIRSDSRVYTSLPSYRAMVALGRLALPYLQQKMEHDSGFDFMLAYAAAEIEGWKISDFQFSSVQEFRDQVLAKMRAQR